MRILSRRFAGLWLLLLPALASAQDFPNKPIRLIVPFPAGGPNDIIARVVGQRMSDIVKQPSPIFNAAPIYANAPPVAARALVAT